MRRRKKTPFEIQTVGDENKIQIKFKFDNVYLKCFQICVTRNHHKSRNSKNNSILERKRNLHPMDKKLSDQFKNEFIETFL